MHKLIQNTPPLTVYRLFENMSEVTDSILFRQKLYDNFKESGLLSKLKTSLRANLLQKLEKPAPIPQPEDNDKHLPFHLRRKFLQSIIAEYLTIQKLEYSLSIFMAECSLEEEDCLRYNELSQITNLGAQAEGRPFLWRLVQQFGKIRCQGAVERSTQTDFGEPLSKKLELIDQQYRPKIDYWKLIPASNIEKVPDSLYEHQQKLRMKFNAEKEQFRRELEVSLKQELQKKYENQYLSRMREVQKQHQGRLNELKHREKAVLDGLQRKRKDLEEKSKTISDIEMKMINKYELRQQQLEAGFKVKQKELEDKEKEFWKRELELKAKKREYEDTIRLVKQKAVIEATQ